MAGQTPPDPDGSELDAPTRRARIRMVVAYDGSGFRGFAANPGVRTVGGELARALETVLREPVALTCAGRTDAGVHARGQVVSFDAPADRVRLSALQRSVNGMCAPEVVVTDIAVVDDDFDARFSAVARRYRYSVLTGEHPDPFLARTAWHVPEPLDHDAVVLACDPFVGRHDFSSFCRRPRPGEGAEPVSLERRVRSLRWRPDGQDPRLWHLEIEADAFCQQMVRSIVGTLVDVGRGRRRAGDIRAMMRAGDRAAAAPVAPPHGLCLWEVVYAI